MTQLVNIHNFHSDKKNKDYCIIQIVRDLYESEKSKGYIGVQKFEEIFLPDSLVGTLTADHIGKNLDLEYVVENGKAELVHIKVK